MTPQIQEILGKHYDRYEAIMRKHYHSEKLTNEEISELMSFAIELLKFIGIETQKSIAHAQSLI